MKYCLTGKQDKKYLADTDEILLQIGESHKIPEYFIEYPNATIILDVPAAQLENAKKTIKMYAEASDKLCCRIYDLKQSGWFKKNNIKFYYAYPIDNYYDLQGLIDLGVEYIKIGAPLGFDVNVLKRYKEVKFRMVPNVAYSAYIPRANGLLGQWVRPEDVRFYEDAIYVFEFEDFDTLEKERALFRIYKQGEWNDELKLLITNLDMDIANTFLPPDFGEVRSMCQQKCMRMRYCCDFCQHCVDFHESALRESFRRLILEQE